MSLRLPSPLSRHANLIQLIGFQVVWFNWALGVPAGLYWPGLLSAVLFLALHGLWLPQARVDRRMALGSVLAGLILDSALMGAGLLSFPAPNPPPLAGLQPWWMTLLWACLGCTLNHSLAWLKGRTCLAAALSAVAGALSYEAAARMGALELTDPTLTWVLLAVFWALFIPWMLNSEHPQTPG
jgi:hypothetical protein